MKILRVIASTNPKGGGPIEGIRQLQEPLVRMGHLVDIVCCDALDAPWLNQLGAINIYACGPGRSGYGYAPLLLPWLKANVSNYDVVIVHGIWQYHSFAAWRALAGGKTPYFVFTHGMLDPWFKRTYPLKHLKKWLYWPWAEYRVLRDAQSVIFTCEEERILARESFWLYRCQETVTSYGTATPPESSAELAGNFLDEYPELRGKRLFLFLSRIHEKKGCDLLIDAFSQVASSDQSLHLVIAGPDQTGWRAKLQAQALALGIADRITWPGMLEGDMKWGAYHSAEVFCLPSHQENFGIVVAEALGCGKPVLISNKVNIWREIETDGAGFVNEDTVEGTVAGLRQWLATTNEQKIDMTLSAKACFEARYKIDKVAENLIRIISNK